MASTAQAARLTEVHRLAQARLGALTVQQLLAAWRMIDLASLDETAEAWLRVAVPLIQAQRSASAGLAANYYQTFRALEVGAGIDRFVPLLAGPADPRAVSTSLLVTGPYRVRHGLALGRDATKMLDIGGASSSAAGMRHALTGGRETLVGSARADRKALGWARVTSGNPCAFCAMLASRGPVYTEQSGDFEAHDHCSCTAEPVFSTDSDWPPGAREYREQWDDATAAASGDDKLAAFRASFDA